MVTPQTTHLVVSPASTPEERGLVSRWPLPIQSRSIKTVSPSSTTQKLPYPSTQPGTATTEEPSSLLRLLRRTRSSLPPLSYAAWRLDICLLRDCRPTIGRTTTNLRLYHPQHARPLLVELQTVGRQEPFLHRVLQALPTVRFLALRVFATTFSVLSQALRLRFLQERRNFLSMRWYTLSYCSSTGSNAGQHTHSVPHYKHIFNSMLMYKRSLCLR